MKPVEVDSPYMMLVWIDDLGDGSSRKLGTEGVVGTPKSAQVETKLEPDTTGPTKEAVGNFDTALLEKDDYEELGKKGSEKKTNQVAMMMAVLTNL